VIHKWNAGLTRSLRPSPWPSRSIESSSPSTASDSLGTLTAQRAVADPSCGWRAPCGYPRGACPAQIGDAPSRQPESPQTSIRRAPGRPDDQHRVRDPQGGGIYRRWTQRPVAFRSLRGRQCRCGKRLPNAAPLSCSQPRKAVWTTFLLEWRFRARATASFRASASGFTACSTSRRRKSRVFNSVDGSSE
jgi:hypothetical protein